MTPIPIITFITPDADGVRCGECKWISRCNMNYTMGTGRKNDFGGIRPPTQADEPRQDTLRNCETCANNDEGTGCDLGECFDYGLWRKQPAPRSGKAEATGTPRLSARERIERELPVILQGMASYREGVVFAAAIVVIESLDAKVDALRKSSGEDAHIAKYFRQRFKQVDHARELHFKAKEAAERDLAACREENERLKILRSGKQHPSWATASRESILDALDFQGQMTNALLAEQERFVAAEKERDEAVADLREMARLLLKGPLPPKDWMDADDERVLVLASKWAKL